MNFEAPLSNTPNKESEQETLPTYFDDDESELQMQEMKRKWEAAYAGEDITDVMLAEKVLENKEECNDTELLLNRLRDADNQIWLIHLYLDIAEKDIALFGKDSFWVKQEMPELPGRNIWWNPAQNMFIERAFKPGHFVTIVEVEEYVLGKIKEIETSTPVTLDGSSMSTRDAVSINATLHGKPLTAKQKSITESHEKGHIVRVYDGAEAIFSGGFDSSQVVYTEDDFKADIAAMEAIGRDPEKLKEITIEDARNAKIEYLLSASEIAERMSQLKNFFGLKGSEIFTKSHLRYARAHYIEETGMDNDMRFFFQAITPETETKFITLINESGI